MKRFVTRIGVFLAGMVLLAALSPGRSGISRFPSPEKPSEVPEAVMQIPAGDIPAAPIPSLPDENGKANDSGKDIRMNDWADQYKNQVPKEWSETAAGVKTKLDTKEKVVALTFDACGGKGGDGYDKRLMDYLMKENIPATLFINSRWIDENPGIFAALAQNGLFEIENHGTEHSPLSVNGRSAYHIPGTKSVQGVIDEVKTSGDKINERTGKKPKFFRSGTNYYDEIAVRIVKDLGEEAVGYSVLGDAGATYSAAQIKKACLAANPGSIILFHMNHPEKDTAAGVMEAVPALRDLGFRFAKLEDYPLK